MLRSGKLDPRQSKTMCESDETLIQQAEKAIPIAEAHIAAGLRRHIANLRANPSNADSRFWLKTDTSAAYYHRHIKTYGRD